MGMNRAISGFLAQVAAGSEVLFYYAGPGVELSDLPQGREEQRLHPRDFFIARLHNPR